MPELILPELFVGLEGGLDAGIGAGLAGGLDAGIAGGVDAGLAGGLDAGLGAGIDAGVGAGVDAGIGAGAEAFGAGAGDLTGGLIGTDAGLSEGAIGAGLGPEAGAGEAFGSVAPEVGGTTTAGSFAPGFGTGSALGAPSGFGPALAGDPLGSVFSGVGPIDSFGAGAPDLGGTVGGFAGGPDILGTNTLALPSGDALPGVSGVAGDTGGVSGLGADTFGAGAPNLSGTISDPFSGQFADAGAGQAPDFGAGVNAGELQPTNIITSDPFGGTSTANLGGGTSEALSNQSMFANDFGAIGQSNISTGLTNPTLSTDLQDEAFLQGGNTGLPQTGDVFAAPGQPGLTPNEIVGQNFTGPTSFVPQGDSLIQPVSPGETQFTGFGQGGNPVLGDQAPGQGFSIGQPNPVQTTSFQPTVGGPPTETLPGVAPPSGNVSGPITTVSGENAAIGGAGPGVTDAGSGVSGFGGGDAGTVAGTTAGAGSNNAFLASLGLTPTTAAALGIGVGGLGLGILRSQQPLPDQNQINQIAQQLAQNSAGANQQAQELINPLITGILPPGQAAQVQQALQDAITTTKAKYSQLGMSGSTAETDQIASLIQRSISLAGSLEQQMANAGIQLGSQAQQDLNIEGTLFSTLMNAQINQDNALSAAIAQFAGQAAIAGALGSRSQTTQTT